MNACFNVKHIFMKVRNDNHVFMYFWYAMHTGKLMVYGCVSRLQVNYIYCVE